MVSSLSQASVEGLCELWRLVLPGEESEEDLSDPIISRYTRWVEQCAPLAQAGVAPVPVGVEHWCGKYINFIETVRKWEDHQRVATWTTGASALPSGC